GRRVLFRRRQPEGLPAADQGNALRCGARALGRSRGSAAAPFHTRRSSVPSTAYRCERRRREPPSGKRSGRETKAEGTTERRRSRTDRAVGCTTALVLKRSHGFVPTRMVEPTPRRWRSRGSVRGTVGSSYVPAGGVLSCATV